MTASSSHRAPKSIGGATITRLADHQRTAEAQTYMDAMYLPHLRPTQQQALAAQEIRHARHYNRKIIAAMAGILLAVLAVNLLGSAITAHIAANLGP